LAGSGQKLVHRYFVRDHCLTDIDFHPGNTLKQNVWHPAASIDIRDRLEIWPIRGQAFGRFPIIYQ